MSSASTALLDKLLRSGKIREEQREATLAAVQGEEGHVVDLLIDRGVVDESSLLKFIAAEHGTRFVSTEKLASARVDSRALALIGRAFAMENGVFPVAFQPDTQALAVVSGDLGDAELVKRLQEGCEASSVTLHAARPAAVRAAIQKHYSGDIHAFAKLDREEYEAFQSMLDVYERHLFTEESLDNSIGTQPQPYEPELGHADRRTGTLVSATATSELGHGDDLGGSLMEVVAVLVSMMENQRPELTSHSAQVARLLQSVGARMGLSTQELTHLRLLGLLHDVGKTSHYHLTGLNVAEYEGHRAHALKCYLTPVRMLESADLPAMCVDGLTYVYERMDGEGFPDRREGQDIPLAARLLAIAETYADLVSNARNPFRKRLTPGATMEVLERYRDTVFDGNLLDLFRVAALGADLQARLLGDRPRVVLCGTDAEDMAVLQFRLAERGCEVLLCHTTNEAYRQVQEEVDVLITEVNLEPQDGFRLVRHLRNQSFGADLPVVFLTRRADRASVDQGFELGAVDYIVKPASADVIVNKVLQALAGSVGKRGARGVSGSLAEMPLPDVLQVLSRAGKTGRLRVSGGGAVGELHVREGDVYNAMFRNERGESAVYAMLRLTEGEFALDPTFKTTTREIHCTTESLLLEAMRRWDEERDNLSATRVE